MLPRIGGRSDGARYEKKQLVHRQPAEFVRRVLSDFNAGSLDAATAASHLGVSRARLYQLRSAFLRGRDGYAPMASGGDRRGDWPPESKIFLEEFLPLQNPPNYQLVADELERLCGVVRARSSVEAHVKAHYAHLVPTPQRKPRAYRRFRRARIGELPAPSGAALRAKAPPFGYLAPLDSGSTTVWECGCEGSQEGSRGWECHSEDSYTVRQSRRDRKRLS